MDHRDIFNQQLDLTRLWLDDRVMELIYIYDEDPPLDRISEKDPPLDHILDGDPPLDHARVKCKQLDQARSDPDEELKVSCVQHSEGHTFKRHTWED